jgi:hypothetical protein
VGSVVGTALCPKVDITPLAFSKLEPNLMMVRLSNSSRGSVAICVGTPNAVSTTEYPWLNSDTGHS